MPPLRHLVFFKFLASSTPEQQEAVARALFELPSVIPNILSFKIFRPAVDLFPGHSVTGPPYAMLIDSIFASADALSVYAPHPAHQGVINRYIAPIREDTFVVDYLLSDRFNVDAWQQLQRPPHIRHFVMYSIKPEHAGQEATINKELEQLQTVLPSILSTQSGQQRLADLYPGYGDRSKGIVNVIELLFKDREGRQEYNTHQAHKDFIKKNLPLAGEVVTFDYECQ